MNFHYLTYVAGEPYETTLRDKTSLWLEYNGNFFKTKNAAGRKWLETTEEYKKNSEKFSSDLRGAGYWRWKPLLILESLKSSIVDDGDLVCYFDVDDIFTPDFPKFCQSWFNLSCQYKTGPDHSNFVMISKQPNEPMEKWTRKDVFHYLNIDNEKAHTDFMVEAGMITFKKCQDSIDLLEEWYELCMDDRGIVEDRDENLCGLENGFIFVDHRHDQSILSALVHKKGLSCAGFNGRVTQGNYFSNPDKKVVPLKPTNTKIDNIMVNYD